MAGKVVQAGYNVIAERYLQARNRDSADVQALSQLTARLPANALLLDAGCGAGLPITARLVDAGHRVVGVDFALAQLALARTNVPGAAVVCQDLTQLGFAAGVFDAVCSYYAIIHIPRERHEGVLAGFHRLLKPGGLVFLCLGAQSIDDDFDNDYFGVRMYWSHYDAPTYLALLPRLGFKVLWAETIADALDGDQPLSGHLFVLARKLA